LSRNAGTRVTGITHGTNIIVVAQFIVVGMDATIYGVTTIGGADVVIIAINRFGAGRALTVGAEVTHRANVGVTAFPLFVLVVTAV
jgi:serine acetyltransferase